MKQKKEACCHDECCKDNCCKESICQSCAIPLNEKNKGLNADKTINHEYCNFCFEKGIFKSPHLTLEQMIEKLVGFHQEMRMTPDQAKEYALKTLSSLKRWKKKSK
jgi:hypothetical protein